MVICPICGAEVEEGTSTCPICCAELGSFEEPDKESGGKSGEEPSEEPVIDQLEKYGQAANNEPINLFDDDEYTNNARPKALTIHLEGLRESVTFPDEKAVMWVELTDPVKTTFLEFFIDDVYYSRETEWDDTVITEIYVYGTPVR